MCKTEAHAYVTLYPGVVGDYVQMRPDCVRRVSENLNQRVKMVNTVYCVRGRNKACGCN